MRIQAIFRQFPGVILALGMGAIFVLGARADEVAARCQFAGATALGGEENYSIAKKLLDLATSVDFEKLVVRRFADYLATGLPKAAPEAGTALEPLLQEWLGAEWALSAGGPENGPVQFVVALKSSAGATWNAALSRACGETGTPVNAGGANGWKWGEGATAVWVLQAHDWLVAGRGEGLNKERDEFLRRIAQEGRPAPALGTNCLEADVDWARLERLLPISLGGLKPAHTAVELTATPDHILRLTARVTYPEPITWHESPWAPPTSEMHQPLISFTAAQDLAAFLKTDVFGGLPGDPFTDQMFCWAINEMPFQSYAAWPVSDAAKVMQEWSTQAPAKLNPELKNLDGSQLRWDAPVKHLVWTSPYNRLVAPVLTTLTTNGHSYLMASMFPLRRRAENAPEALFEQFTHRENVVYFDWEVTGPRLEQWRLLSEMFPLVKRITPEQMTAERKSLRANTNTTAKSHYVPSFVTADNWLSGMAPHLNTETITEVTKTGPAELTIRRRSPIVFTGIELELLTHWMAHSPSVGHIDRGLLPPAAKVSGPGMPRH